MVGLVDGIFSRKTFGENAHKGKNDKTVPIAIAKSCLMVFKEEGKKIAMDLTKPVFQKENRFIKWSFRQ